MLEQSRNLKQSKLNKNVFIQLYIQYKIDGFYDKARIIYRKTRKLLMEQKHCHVCLHHTCIGIPVRITMMLWFWLDFFSFQVEVAKQKKQHENNQIYFIDILFLETWFLLFTYWQNLHLLPGFLFLFHKTQSLKIIILKNTWKLHRNCKEFNVRIFFAWNLVWFFKIVHTWI